LAATGVCALLAGLALIPAQSAPGQKVPSPAAATASFRVVFGYGDTAPAVWDGSVKVTGGRVSRVVGWRFAENDAVEGAVWKASTRRSAPNALAALRGEPGPMSENGVIVDAVLDTPGAEVAVTTTQGNFSFAASSVDWGAARKLLDGKAKVERVPSTYALTRDDHDDDFPAAAATRDEVWMVYTRFTHANPDKERLTPPAGGFADFEFLARPAGGDQVMLMRYSRKDRAWDAPEAVSAAGQDVMRAAVAVDGKKRVWVIWSANKGGNFDLYAKYRASGVWSKEIRLTTDAGTDVNPVAAADSKGRVWVAWQGARGGNLEVLAAAQDDTRFSAETKLSFSRMSDWDPAIAASRTGEVAVSWDTYHKGDYDVYVRRLSYADGIRAAEPVPAAASAGFEARSSIAYDARGRLWVAYETAPEGWAKDYGWQVQKGFPIFQLHNVAVRCLDGVRALTPVDDVARVLPLAPPQLNLNAKVTTPQDHPMRQKERPLNSIPRLAVDDSGTLVLAFRYGTKTLVRTTEAGSLGAVYLEQFVYHDGSGWKGPVEIPNTEGRVDNRPALVAMGAGEMLAVSAMDHRQMELRGAERGTSDGFPHDLYAAEFQLPRARTAGPLADANARLETSSAVKPEEEQVRMMRNYRTQIAGANVQVLRGEFHRHTELSGDGGRDGPLIDAYRYLIDAAYMDWAGCCDHDNGGAREYWWWISQKLTDAYNLGPAFVPMFSYERSVRYPEGHRNVIFANRGVRVLPRLPKVPEDAPFAPAPDTQMLYRYLRRFGGITSVHTSATDQGTDWRDSDPALEPVVEIFQGARFSYERDDAPRNATGKPSDAGYQPKGFVSNALLKGIRLGFQSSSDHNSTHTSYANILVTSPTRAGVMEAFRKRRVYGATSNILADVRSGERFMGEEFETSSTPELSVKLWGTAPFARVHVIRDNVYVHTVSPGARQVSFTWRDAAAERGKTSYYYVRGEQEDGELVWVSPMWIRYRP